MQRLIWQIVAGLLGIFLATKFVPGVALEIIPGQSSFLGIEFTKTWQILLLVGTVFGLLNFFLKPLLNVLTLPIKLLTLGLFGLIINMAMVWLVDIIFPEFIVKGIVALFLTTAIIWGVSFFLGLVGGKMGEKK